jgi:multidrug efflux system membrane fusion protein
MVAAAGIGLPGWGYDRAVMRMQRFRPYGALAGLALLAACSGGEDKAASGAGRRPPQLVAAQRAALEDFAPTLVALGTVTPRQSVAVRARADGEITDIAFAEGDTVRAGQLLFKLDSRQAEAAVAQAQAEVKGAIAAERRATLDYERAEALVGKGFVSAAARDLARANAYSARSQIETTRALLRAAEVQLSFLTIRAPISGRTGELGLRRGANVRQGDTAPLVTINQLSPIHVRFLVPADAVPKARAVLASGGDVLARARDDAGGSVLARGRLVFLDNNVDPGNGGVAARAEFANAGETLWPGAIVTVELPLAKPQPRIALPESAVQTGRDAPFVWAVAGGGRGAGAPDAAAGKANGPNGGGAGGAGAKVTMRDVVVAGRMGGKVYLASGVQAGEQVVVDALARLRDGDAVRIRPAGGPSGARPPVTASRGAPPARAMGDAG